MNYILEIRAFFDWLETHPLPASAISLWHALLYIDNKSGWQKEFCVAISTLSAKSGLTPKAVLSARKRLQQCGLVSCRKRGREIAAAYRLTSLAERWDLTVGKNGGSEVGDKVGSEVGDKVGREVGSEVGSRVGSEVGGEVDSEVGREVGNRVGDRVGDRVGSEVGDRVGSEVGDKVGSEVGGAAKNGTGSAPIIKQKQKQKQTEKEKSPFAPPSLKEVRAYCEERHSRVDPSAFLDFYQAKGWRIGNASMRDWKACVRAWERRKSDELSGGTAENHAATNAIHDSRYGNVL